jgi:hypothetical protein
MSGKYGQNMPEFFTCRDAFRSLNAAHGIKHFDKRRGINGLITSRE